jgi:O-antigen/teichoic acid export membrane protein
MPFKLLRRYKSRYAPKESFAARVVTLMTGTTIAQSIPIAISPILTRLYAPSDFGVFALFSSVVSLVAIIATGRYELAIMLPEDDEDAINLLGLSVGITMFVCCLCTVVIGVFNTQITALLNNQEISIWLYWIPLAVLLTGIYQALNYWSTRRKHYKRLSMSRLTQSVSTASINLAMGFSKIGVGGLILGNIVGQSCATGIMGWQVWRADKNRIELISKKSMRKNAKKYRNFPLINAFHAFLDAAQTSGIVFLIAVYYGGAVLGLYSFVMRLLRMPVNLIGSSVSQVFYQEASEIYNRKGNLHYLLRITMIRLGLAGLPILIFILLFAPDMFGIFFGADWVKAGVYAQILSPWIFFNFIVSPISGIYLIVGKQRQAILFGVLDTALKFLSVAYGVYCNDPIIGFYAMTVTGLIILIAEMFWAFKIIQIPKIESDGV